LLRPSLLVGVSHILAHAIEVQPLGKLLGQAIDGSETINDKLWHPFGGPGYHRPSKVEGLAKKLASAWQASGCGRMLYLPDEKRAEAVGVSHRIVNRWFPTGQLRGVDTEGRCFGLVSRR
jgi:hypothetical protein